LKLSSTALRLAAEPAASVESRPRRQNDGTIGVIWNPRSHRNRGVSLNAEFDGVDVVTPLTKRALAQALAKFAAAGIETLIVKGGDGTVRDVLTYGAPIFGDHWPRLVMVPRGKTNALAIDLGLPRAWSFDAVMDAIARGKTVTRRPLVIERESREQAMLGFIFGAGAFNAAIDAGQVAHRFGAFQGAAVGLTAAIGLAQTVFGIGNSPWRTGAPMRLRGIGGEDGGEDAGERGGAVELPHSGRGGIDNRYLAFFSTLRRFPAGMAPFPESDTAIRYLLLDAPIRRVTGRLPWIITGVHRPFYPALGIHRGGGTAFELDLGGRFTLDGESFGSGRLTMRQGPALEFIVP
jgi:diacylglycerol kinase (ATP)